MYKNISSFVLCGNNLTGVYKKVALMPRHVQRTFMTLAEREMDFGFMRPAAPIYRRLLCIRQLESFLFAVADGISTGGERKAIAGTRPEISLF